MNNIHNTEDKFVFKEVQPTPAEHKNIVACVLEIATRTLFENHCYRFGKKVYKQEQGGSIGDRWTGSAAEMVVQDWSEEYREILSNSGLKVHLLAGYVDDAGNNHPQTWYEILLRKQEVHVLTRRRERGQEIIAAGGDKKHENETTGN